MLIGMVGLGIVVGIFSAVVAVFSGYSLLMALLIYALFGALAILTAGIGIFISSEMQERRVNQTYAPQEASNRH